MNIFRIILSDGVIEPQMLINRPSEPEETGFCGVGELDPSKDRCDPDATDHLPDTPPGSHESHASVGIEQLRIENQHQCQS